MSDRRQRQKEQRAAKREAERKQAARKELGRRLLTALVFGLVVVAIFAVSGIFGAEDSDLPSAYQDFREQPTACSAEPPPPLEPMTFSAPEPQEDVGPGTEATATISTSCGDIVIDLATETSPATVQSFAFLAREDFYDGQAIHRVSEDFVIQGGDPAADGTGGPGYVIEDEFPEDSDFVYEEGVVAMANRGARSTGSQFFIVIGEDAQHLTPLFNVLGTVRSGQDAIDRIASVETSVATGSVEESRPEETVYIESVSVETEGP